MRVLLKITLNGGESILTMLSKSGVSKFLNVESSIMRDLIEAEDVVGKTNKLLLGTTDKLE